MSAPRVTSLTSATRFLAAVWDAFPIVYAARSADKAWKMALLEYWMEESEDLCLSLSGQARAQFGVGKVSDKGGQGEVGALALNDAQVVASALSLAPDGAWMPFYQEVFMKVALKAKKLTSEVMERKGVQTVYSSEPLHEAILSAAVGHLAASEVGLALPRYYGVMACPQGRQHRVGVIMEKSDASLYDALGCDSGAPPTLSWPELLAIVVHVGMQFAINKVTMGISHYDAHMKNIMFQVLADKPTRTDVYLAPHVHARSAYEVEAFEYLVPGGRVRVPNVGLLPRVIDWGVAKMDLTRAVGPNRMPFVFEMEHGRLKGFARGVKASTSPNQGDIDFNFFIINIVYAIAFSRHFTEDPKAERALDALLAKAEALARAVVPVYADYFPDGIALGVDEDDNEVDWFFNTRDVGTTDDPWAHVHRLLDYVGKETPRGAWRPQGDALVTYDFRVPVASRSMLGKYLARGSVYFRKCVVGAGDVKECRRMLVDLVKYAPATTLPTHPERTYLSMDSALWKARGRTLRQGLTAADLRGDAFVVEVAPGMDVFHLHIEAPRFPRLVLAGGERLVYLPSHRLTNFEPPAPELIGTPLPSVDLFLTYVDPARGATLAVALGTDLWDAARRVPRGVSLNGNFFVVDRNLHNPLTSYLTDDDVGLPIGYWAMPDGEGRTVLPVPPPYRDEYAAVVADAAGRVRFMPLPEFYAQHDVAQVPLLVYCCGADGEVAQARGRDVVAAVSVPVITGRRGLDYTFAMEAGAVLVWEGQRVFTRERMESLRYDMPTLLEKYPATDAPLPWALDASLVRGDASRFPFYKLSRDQATTQAYFNLPGEYAFAYDQRFSNSNNVWHVLCETFDGELLSVLSAGRGYDAPGIDRAQLSALLAHLNVRHAVSLDGGFSANVLASRARAKAYVLPDPEKRPLGLSLHFIAN